MRASFRRRDGTGSSGPGSSHRAIQTSSSWRLESIAQSCGRYYEPEVIDLDLKDQHQVYASAAEIASGKQVRKHRQAGNVQIDRRLDAVQAAAL